ncbi:MAG: hypothetical protein II875_04010 [Clostridia bacterium]|nr:hypothetical protein [Clostridia bacterium]
MEEFSTVLPILLVFVAAAAFAGITGNLKRKAEAQRKAARPQQSQTPAEPSAPTFEPRPSAPFARPYEADAGSWDSRAEFHEGEDPCHDDMDAIAPEELRRSAPEHDPRMDDLIKGFVIGEVLSRRKNNNWQRQ